MATVSSASQGGRPSVTRRAEHLFFTSYMLALAVLAIAGFAPSFFLRGVLEPYAPLRPLRPEVVVHAALATSLIVLFPIQAFFAARGRLDAHRKVGAYGFILAVAVTLSAYFIAIGPYHEPLPPGMPEGMTTATALVLPLSDFFTLLILVPLAWLWRNQAASHKRAMTLIACLLAGAGVYRLPFGDRATFEGVLAAQAILFSLVLPLWVWDVLSMTRLHKATVVGSAILFVDFFGRMFWAPTTGWVALVRALPGYGWP